MKHFHTLLLAFAFGPAALFAFPACGPSSDNDDISKTVIFTGDGERLLEADGELTLDINRSVQTKTYMRLNISTDIKILGSVTYCPENDSTDVRTDIFYSEPTTEPLCQFLDLRRGRGIEGGIIVKGMTLKNVSGTEGRIDLKTIEFTSKEVTDTHLFVENGKVKVGVDLTYGGGISYFERKGMGVKQVHDPDGVGSIITGDVPEGSVLVSDEVNLINHYDPGRLLQQSYYGERYPDVTYNNSSWAYNPVQGGDQYGNTSQLIDFRVSDNEIYVKCRPLDWAKAATTTNSYMESWITLEEDGVVRVRNRYTDFTGDGPRRPRTQELPALYLVYLLNQFVCCHGSAPRGEGELSRYPNLGFWGQDDGFHGRDVSECWSAWVNDEDFGFGLFTPEAHILTSGRYAAGSEWKPYDEECFANSMKTAAPADGLVQTVYTTNLAYISLPVYGTFEYTYFVMADGLETMRGKFNALAEKEHNPSLSNADRPFALRRPSPEERTQLRLSGIDELGRTVTPSDGDKDGKYVGMFYFLWQGSHPLYDHDINWLEENDPEHLWAPPVRPGGWLAYYWGKPLYGYYHQSDEWVVTRHVEMLMDAGIDFLGLDMTNTVTYDPQMELLMNVLLKFQSQGFKVPKLMPLTRTKAVETAAYLYNKWYKDEKYDSLWFAPNGKPMISCATEWDEKYNEVMSHFDVKYFQWPNEGKDYDNGFAWIEWKYPQPLHSESRMMSVSTSQHVSGKMSQKDANWGRSYNFKTGVNENWRLKEGLNYQSQWDTALSTDGVDIVFITGWNEWHAGKFMDGKTKQVFFVDQFDTDYSRDIEMMEGGYGDCYYMQTVENVRRFKSVGETARPIRQKTVDIDGPLSQWDDAAYVYRDFEGDALERNFKGSVRGYFHTDRSNRNDIVTVKVATDKEYAYFYVETAADITEYDGGTNWMNILIGKNAEGGFEGYEYLLNASPHGKVTSVSRFTGEGFAHEDAGGAQLRVSGRVMQLQVRLSAIGVDPEKPYFAFKVCDNVTKQGDIMDYYVSGDCAPIGRLSYTYGY